MSAPKYRPGEKAPASGQYPLDGPRGGDQSVEVTVTRSEPFPPTPRPGMGYGPPDKTKHRGKEVHVDGEDEHDPRRRRPSAAPHAGSRPPGR